MSENPNLHWTNMNQRFLATRLREVQRLFENGGSSPSKPDFAESDAIAGAMERAPALKFVSESFGLSGFEELVLLLCAGYELDGQFARSLAVYRPEMHSRPCFEIAFSLSSESHWSATTPMAPLRHWRQIELEPGKNIVGSALRIDERILHYLSGLSYLDTRLHGILRSGQESPCLAPSLENCVEQIISCWRKVENNAELPIIQLCGQRLADGRAIAQAACKQLGLVPYFLDIADIPVAYAEREALLTLWHRESILDRAALIINADEQSVPRLNNFCAGLYSPSFLVDKQPAELSFKASVRIDVPASSSAEQFDLWQNALGDDARYLNGGLRHVVSQFNLSARDIVNVSQLAITPEVRDGGDADSALWQVCRLHSRKRLDSLAQRITSSISWDDLVLPTAQRQMVEDIVNHSRQRFTVYEEWGFKNKSSNGLGISAIFFGSSGTGKTMAASVIANALKLDLYRIDLSQIVNKYIGETEKNLARVFDAAENSGAILLFDEADSLFAKRTEVKNSYDRNANMETSYLLQRMESYNGLAILTTNLKKEMDSAFMRRIRFAVHFPFPDKEIRQEIWRRIFPAQTPLGEIDINKLALLDVAGGNIRNIALNAAFLAAEKGETVTMPRLAKAARREFSKIEKSIKESDLRTWL